MRRLDTTRISLTHTHTGSIADVGVTSYCIYIPYTYIMLYPKVFGYSIIVAFHVCRLPCKDLMVSRCTKRIREKVTEQEMWVDGEFASEEDMKGELNLNE